MIQPKYDHTSGNAGVKEENFPGKIKKKKKKTVF